MHVTPPTVVDALMGVLDVGSTQGDEENTIAQGHISDVDEDLAIEVPATGGIPTTEVVDVEHVKSEMEIIPTTKVGNDIPIIKGTFA